MRICLTHCVRLHGRWAVRPVIHAAFILLAVLAVLAVSMPNPAFAADPTWHRAGGFEFSDRLGGFRILSVSGTGTISDPIVIDQDLGGPGPFVITIRNAKLATGTPIGPILRLWIVSRVRNAAAGVWVGFDVELQEILRKPSDYWDGLSFDQTRKVDGRDFHSDRFREGERIAEPHDRVRFKNGHVDSGTAVQFSFVITDMTPRDEFYLLQEPVLLFSKLPVAGPSSAG